jgi:UDP-N-acetylglucosamine 1-carboxyvinyltransferase
MAAVGTTDVSGVQHVDRGYEHFVEQLGAAGAAVERHLVGTAY